MQTEQLLTAKEVADHFRVSVRTVERWIEKGLPAHKATEIQVGELLVQKRIGGLPPKGIWVIPQSSLTDVHGIRKSVGYPAEKKRKQQGTC
ncbi:hypothetical protein KDH_12280 [Dictyobacter sp. S3.2.2.5]|uniref:Helix-turn-helix domain-containing protein n=2 Tax=Dictyobacter halimunensis TaxID=3026934 RepID=A0ABQ6FJJ1_9CHLR|nr:hypothetical protein KDH_12280 [Dictyobacter sp. S3.2.2.5]